MSGATYRIELEHTPGDTFAWYVKIYHLSEDGYPVHVEHGSDGAQVLGRARAWVAAQNIKHPTQILHVGDDGNDAEFPAGHSVKVTE